MMENSLKSEDGTTLAEILVTVALLGLAVAAIVAALGSLSLSSDRHRKQVNADTVVRSYAEAIKQRSAMGLYAPCAATTYTTPTWSAPTGYTASILTTGTDAPQYWHSSGGFSPTCGSDEGAQKLTLRATSNDGRDVETLSIVVRTP